VSSVRSDLTRQQIDAELREVDGVARWTEPIYGGEVSCRLNGRHLVKVLRARPGYLASRPQLRLVLPGVRTVNPSAERRLQVIA
jgi:hypothetical protein